MDDQKKITGYVHSLESFGSVDGPGDLFERLRHALSVLPQSGHLANENRDGVHSR